MQVNSSNPEFFGAKGVYFVTEKKKIHETSRGSMGRE